MWPLCFCAGCAAWLAFEKATGAAAETGAAEAVENSRPSTTRAAAKKNLMNFIIKKLFIEVTIKPIAKSFVIKFLQ
jgi:ABC-type proline/glycine betaine transport system substrate-binding protein